MLRIECPTVKLEKKNRIDLLFKSIDRWVSSKALAELVILFSGEMPKTQKIQEKIEWLNDFANVWDYRKKQANGGERWNIKDDALVQENTERIMLCAKQLGLVDTFAPLEKPDYVLPLGGARLSNYVRAISARHLIDQYPMADELKVVALSGKRPINEIELPYLAEYAPDAQTEFDAISSGVAKAFGVAENEFEEKDYEDDNINLSWSVRRFLERPNGVDLFSLAAPSSDPSRRANSVDTFEFFLKHFDIQKGQHLLLVTSSIYVPFQLLRFIPLAIEKGFYVDCVGCDPTLPSTAFSQPSNYLQETKAAINAMYALVKLYL